MISGLYIKLLGVGLVLAVVVGGWLYVSSLQSENTRLIGEVATLGSKLKDQNDAVDALKKDADTRLATAENELKMAKAETKAAKQRSTVVYKTKPQNPENLCASALDLVNGGVK